MEMGESFNYDLLDRILADKNRTIQSLEEENKKLKESIDIATKCSSKEEDGIIRLSEENQRLREKNQIYSNALCKEKEENKKLKEDLEDLVKYYKAQIENMKLELKKKTELIRYYKKKGRRITRESYKYS